MSPLFPVEVYGLEVPAGDMPVPAFTNDHSVTLRITMAAIDPSAEPQLDLVPNGSVPRATLKLVRLVTDDDDDEDDMSDDDDIDAIERRLSGVISDEDDDDEESSEDEEEANGGPSDPAKSKKARKAAALKQILEALKDADDMELDAPNGVNGTKSKKGKGKASDDEDEDEDEDEDSELDDDEDVDGEVEEFVICTLDTEKHYQQPIDITIGENEQVYFKVTGTHNVFLTGNYVLDPADMGGPMGYDSEEDDLDYELGSDDDELDDDEDEESDELDDLADPRIAEIDSDEEEAPKLVKAAEKKGKNKRPVEDDANGLDDMINKSLKAADANGDAKRQSKKLKNNSGQAVAGTEESSADKASPAAKSDKKVQFAKNLEQGPTGSPAANKKDAKKDAKKAEPKKDEKPKPALGAKTIGGGIKVDDRKLGSGPAAKNGDKVGMRYIGKLEKDGKVFDSNKKGKPFTFSLGKGQVIKGWDLGIAGMQVGGERRIVIPAPMGYGSKGVPGIPPNSTLVFDVKMLSLN